MHSLVNVSGCAGVGKTTEAIFFFASRRSLPFSILPFGTRGIKNARTVIDLLSGTVTIYFHGQYPFADARSMWFPGIRDIEMVLFSMPVRNA